MACQQRESSILNLSRCGKMLGPSKKIELMYVHPQYNGNTQKEMNQGFSHAPPIRKLVDVMSVIKSRDPIDSAEASEIPDRVFAYYYGNVMPGVLCKNLSKCAKFGEARITLNPNIKLHNQRPFYATGNKRRGAPRDGEGQCAGCDRL